MVKKEQGTRNDEYRKSFLEGFFRQPSTEFEPQSHQVRKGHEGRRNFLGRFFPAIGHLPTAN